MKTCTQRCQPASSIVLVSWEIEAECQALPGDAQDQLKLGRICCFSSCFHYKGNWTRLPGSNRMDAITHNFMQAVTAVRNNRGGIWRVVALPALLIVALSLIPAETAMSTAFISVVSYILYVVLAVGVHRQILLAAAEREGATIGTYGKFAMWSILVPAAGGLFFVPIIALELPTFLLLASLFPALYVIARASLLLPNGALGESAPLGQVWQWSASNGWKLTGAIFLPPFVLDLILSMTTFWMNDFVRDMLVAILSIPVLVLEVAILSVAYRDLRAGYVRS